MGSGFCKQRTERLSLASFKVACQGSILVLEGLWVYGFALSISGVGLGFNIGMKTAGLGRQVPMDHGV